MLLRSLTFSATSTQTPKRPLVIPPNRNRITLSEGVTAESGNYQDPGLPGVRYRVSPHTTFLQRDIQYVSKLLHQLPQSFQTPLCTNLSIYFERWGPCHGKSIYKQPEVYLYSEVDNLTSTTNRVDQRPVTERARYIRKILLHELGHQYDDRVLAALAKPQQQAIDRLYNDGLKTAIDQIEPYSPYRKRLINTCLRQINTLDDHREQMSQDIDQVTIRDLYQMKIERILNNYARFCQKQSPSVESPDTLYNKDIYLYRKNEVMAELFRYAALESMGFKPLSEPEPDTKATKKRHQITLHMKPLYEHLKQTVWTSA